MALQRFMQQLFFRFGIRPAALFVVLACSALVFSLLRVRRATFVATAVTQAPSTVLSSLVPAKVERLHVALGQRVAAGQLLATLSAPELESERDELDARIRRLARAAEVAQLELTRGLNAEQRNALLRLVEVRRDTRRAQAEEQRQSSEELAAVAFLSEAEQLVKAGMLEPAVAAQRAQAVAREASQHKAAGAVLSAENERAIGVRRELDRLGASNGLVEATAELYQAELEVLEHRRAGLEARLSTLNVKAPTDGIVAELLAQGSVAVVGATVARVVPPFASDVVAYIAAETEPPALASEVAFTVMLADGRECVGRTRTRSTGEVTRKPEQLVGPGGFGGFGFPISVPLGSDCRLPIGQVVELRLGTP